MAVTVTSTILRRMQLIGGSKAVLAQLDATGTYEDIGIQLTPSMFRLSVIDSMVLMDPQWGGYIPSQVTDRPNIQVVLSTPPAPTGTVAGHTHAVALDGGASAAEAAHTHAVALDGGASAAEAAHTHAVALDGGASGAEAAHTHGAAVLGGDTAAEAAHTHAVALDGGASADESAHTHAVALDGGASAAEAAHTHAVALDGGTTADESAHTHAVALDGGASAAGAAHTHAFTGTALTTDTFTVVHDATPETNVVYIAPIDGVFGYLNCDNSANNADDYWETAGGERVWVDDNNAVTVGFQVYFDEDGAPVDSRLLINNTIMATDMLVRTSGGKVVRFKHSATAAALGVALYFDDDGVTAALRLNATLPGAANITTSATDDTYRGMAILCAGSNANESTHTHGPGTLADAASGAGGAHSHGPGTLADAASAAGSSHTHGAGTLVDAASGAGAAHSHGPGTLADAASGAGSSHTHGAGTLSASATGAGSSHTHGAGTLADAASAAGSSHTHGAGTLADAASAAGSSHTHGAGTLVDAASGSTAPTFTGALGSGLTGIDAGRSLTISGVYVLALGTGG